MLNPKPSIRLNSLDVFRGITIAGMLLVNKAGLASQVYPPLLHAEWNGCTPTDLVFPFFLFIIGVAIAFSLSQYTEGNRVDRTSVYWRIGRRCCILFALGLLLNGFPTYDFSNIRIMGVLQRISLAYLLATLAVLNLPRRGQWVLAVLLLVGYWVAMSFVPVPGYGAGNLSPDGNMGAYIDRLVIGTEHLYRPDFNSMGDPEGLFSTLPAVVTVLAGYFTGQWLRTQPVKTRTSVGLVLFGIGCLGVGWAWGWVFPINKKLWTSSYVLFTAGWALLLLATCYELIEVRRWRRWGWPFEVMGLNAIFVFVASVLVIKILNKTHVGSGDSAPTTYTWINDNFFLPWAGAMNGSLLFSIVTVLFWWAIAYGMYRQHWFVKV